MDKEVINYGAGIVKFTPTKILYCPARGGVKSYSALEPGVTYALIEDAANSFLINDPNATIEYMIDKPMHSNVRELTVLFPGGIGDVIALKACFEKMDRMAEAGIGPYPKLETINYFCSKDDYPMMLDGSIKYLNINVMNYPPVYEFVESSDAVIGFGPLQRQSVADELSDTMARILGIEPPRVPASLLSREKCVNIIRKLIRNPEKKNVALQIYSSAHYRTIPPYMGVLIAMQLVEFGYDVYVWGGAGQRLRIYDNGEPSPLPENIYDVCGMLDTLEEDIAFLSLMDGFICPDTSGVHIAGSLSLPCISLFGPTSGQWRTGYYPTVVTMSAEAECAPCYNSALPNSCGKRYCDAIIGLDVCQIATAMHKMICKEE